MKTIALILCLSVSRVGRLDALSPPPINFEEEIVEVEGKYYLIEYDKEKQILYPPREIEQKPLAGINPVLLWICAAFSISFWVVVFWLIWKLIF